MNGLDWSVLALYLAGILGIGLYAGRRGKTTAEYLLGGRRIPAWAAAISILASEISAATFIGTPGFAYVDDCRYLQLAFGTLLARIFIAFLLVDIYYRLGVFTVYGFLSERFDGGSRTATAGVFLVARLLASGVRLFIGSLPLAFALDIRIEVAIAIMGSAAAIYTFFGGIKAVIWTDVVQVGIYMTAAIGTIVAIAVILQNEAPGGLGAAVATLAANNKARIFDLSAFGLDKPYHVVSAVIGGLALTMATHGTDQDMVQRMLTCRTSKEGRLSLIASGIIDFPIVIVFLAVGLALYAFYKLHPVGYAAPARDDVFMTFVTTHLPAGIKGLVVAGVCAAVMGSLSTAINALATTTTIDFYKRIIRPAAGDREALLASKIGTLVWSILLMAVAWVSATVKESRPETKLIDMALGVMFLIYGSLLGVFLLGIFTKTRGNAWSNITGMVLGLVGNILLQEYRILSATWLIVSGTAITFFVGALGATPRKPPSREGDTDRVGPDAAPSVTPPT